jgi:hypothetical protein
VASTAACIEISRHVILLGQLARKRQQLRDRRLICHVYATGPGLARERLLERFIDRVLNADPANTPIADPESGAVLTLQYQRNFARRRYFELVIGLVQSPDLEVIHADFLATTPVPVSRHATVAPVGEARSEADWSLVHSAIERARLARRPLDDAFVEELARKRLKYARASYLYPEAQDAGPTPDSSRRIVREIVKLHELADTFPARGNEDRLDGRGS